jgi:hypothetical protein
MEIECHLNLILIVQEQHYVKFPLVFLVVILLFLKIIGTQQMTDPNFCPIVTNLCDVGLTGIDNGLFKICQEKQFKLQQDFIQTFQTNLVDTNMIGE